MKTPKWINKKALLLLHEESLAEFGGPPGLRDEGLLESALARPMNRHAYRPISSLAGLAAAYGESPSAAAQTCDHIRSHVWSRKRHGSVRLVLLVPVIVVTVPLLPATPLMATFFVRPSALKRQPIYSHVPGRDLI